MPRARRLGNWNVREGLPLTWQEGDVWIGEAELSDGVIEYKYVVQTNGGQVRWAPHDLNRGGARRRAGGAAGGSGEGKGHGRFQRGRRPASRAQVRWMEGNNIRLTLPEQIEGVAGLTVVDDWGGGRHDVQIKRREGGGPASSAPPPAAAVPDAKPATPMPTVTSSAPTAAAAVPGPALRTPDSSPNPAPASPSRVGKPSSAATIGAGGPRQGSREVPDDGKSSVKRKKLLRNVAVRDPLSTAKVSSVSKKSVAELREAGLRRGTGKVRLGRGEGSRPSAEWTAGRHALVALLSAWPPPSLQDQQLMVKGEELLRELVQLSMEDLGAAVDMAEEALDSGMDPTSAQALENDALVAQMSRKAIAMSRALEAAKDEVRGLLTKPRDSGSS